MSEIYLTVTQGGLAGFQKLVALKLLRRDLAEDACAACITRTGSRIMTIRPSRSCIAT